MRVSFRRLTLPGHWGRGAGVVLLAGLLTVTWAGAGCESPGKRPRTATRRSTAEPRAPGAAPTPGAETPQPPPPSSKEDDHQVYDPARPCLTRGQVRKGQGVLLGKRSRPDLEQWMDALNRVFDELRVDCADDHFLLLTITTIQMESNVRVDPSVANPNLEQLYANRLKRFREEHVLSAQMLNWSGLDESVRAKLRKDTRQGKVRTEGDLDRYVESDLRPWLLATLKKDYRLPDGLASSIVGRVLPDPVHTIGPMQVDFNKAYRNARKRGEHIESARAMKRLLLDPDTALERGLKEGVYLLWINYRFYRALLPPEEAVLYTAADYNAGEFSSRNSAFQEQLAAVTGRKLALDGDLLQYQDGTPDPARSQTEEAAAALLQADLSPSAVRRDLLYEKDAGFSETATARKVCAQYHAQSKKECRVARLPTGAGNPSAEVKSGITYSPANYAYAYVKRFQANWLSFRNPSADGEHSLSVSAVTGRGP
jgi:hypothetical protein